MGNNKCPQCGAPKDPSANQCRYCGEKFIAQQDVHLPNNQAPKYAQPIQPTYPNSQFQPQMQHGQMYGVQPYWPIKNKTVAGLLGIFLGGFGVHKFYLGKIGSGILYLLFCWTYIPSFIGFIEGIVYLASNDQNFQLKHQVRLKEYIDYPYPQHPMNHEKRS